MSKLRVAIVGATGYSGEELIRILLQHSSVTLTAVAASAQWERPVPLDSVLPQLAGRTDLTVTAFDPDAVAQAADLVFLALPHGVSQSAAPALLEAGCRVIDLAGDFRLKDPAAFQQFYGEAHAHPELLPRAVYGLTEWAGEAVAKADFIANPGCYATTILLAVLPLLKAGLAEPATMIVDAKSGMTGAGRKPNKPLLFAEMNENLWAYKVNAHQHTPEILQAVQTFSGASGSLCFVPHVVPLSRGIHADCYLRVKGNVTAAAVADAFDAAYANAPFVRVKRQGEWPEVRHITGSNYCDIGFTVAPEHGLIYVASVLDNLVKGAAGQAVQNMNRMCGFLETEALL